MRPELSGIEWRLDELDERLARLAPFVGRPRADFVADLGDLRRFGEQVRSWLLGQARGPSAEASRG